MSETFNYVNVALGKPASQSSLSGWSTKLGAGQAVSGVMPDHYAIHTENELNPWWMVDLEYVYRIEKIVIHNRVDGFFERARTCQVEISKDGVSWLTVHSGIAYFLGGKKGAPLQLPLLRRESARFVRISLRTKEFLHLSQVEVYADGAQKIRDRYKLHSTTFGGKYQLRPSPTHLLYQIEGETEGGEANLIGLRLTPIGRLGNQILQIINAVGAARRIGARYVIIVNGGLINVTEPVTFEGITFLPTGAAAPEPGAFLTGNFFYRHDLSPLLEDMTRKESYQVVQDIIAPLFMKPLPLDKDVKHDDELTVHFRAGDIFSDPAAAAGYTQPPLAFYTLLTRHLLSTKRIKRVRLVFENFGNPCIERFIDFLKKMKIPYRTQSGTLMEDLTALVNSKYLVFGFGSFGIAVCYLSTHIDTVFCFQSFSDTGYQDMPSVKNITLIRDRAKKYTKVGEWRNTPQQLKLMLDYPESSLEVVGETAPALVKT
jgi:hypothetical protein